MREFESFAKDQDPLDIEAATWVTRKHNGLNPAQEAELKAWLETNPRHAAAFEDMEGTLGQVRQLPGDEVETLKAELGDAPLHMPLPLQRPAPQTSPTHTGFPLLRPAFGGWRAWFNSMGRLFSQATTAAVVFVILGGGWMGWEHWQRQPTFEEIYATLRGQQLTANLPDGSALMLDTATRAKATLYRDRREVELVEGQAMFRVQSDRAHPFHVRAGQLRITVIGTRFSVRHTQSGMGARNTVIEVEEGRVRVVRIDPAASENALKQETFIELTAGQTVMADREGWLGPVASLPVGAIAVWRDGRVSFDNTPLALALAEFERYGSTGLIVRDPAVAAMPVGGSYRLRELQSFMDALPQVLPVRLVRAGGVTEVVAR